MNGLNVERLMKELSAILSEKYGADIKIKAVAREKEQEVHDVRY